MGRTVPTTSAQIGCGLSFPVSGDVSDNGVYFYNGINWEANAMGIAKGVASISPNYQGTNPKGGSIFKGKFN